MLVELGLQFRKNGFQKGSDLRAHRWISIPQDIQSRTPQLYSYE